MAFVARSRSNHHDRPTNNLGFKKTEATTTRAEAKASARAFHLERGLRLNLNIPMRLHILGDLHLEFGTTSIPTPEADVVILAGDVHLGREGRKWIKTQ